MPRQIFAAGPTWAGNGINYGNDRAFSQFFSQEHIDNELRLIRKYFTRLRIFIPHYQYATTHPIVQRCLYMIDRAVQLGFTEIVWGITSSESTLTLAQYPDFASAAVSRAIAAKNHGVTTFITGNEEEYHVDGTSLTQAHIQTLARTDLYSQVKAVFDGIVSYNLPSGTLSSWLSSGKGQLDTIGMNVYGANASDGAGFCRDVKNFYNIFGSTAYISEYGITFDWASQTMHDTDQYFELKKRHDFIKNIGLSSGYFFLFSHGSDDHFAVRLSNGQHRSMWKAITRDRFSWTSFPNIQVYSRRVPKQ